MNKLISLNLVILSATSSLMATNGDNLISLGVSSRGMGGTGIAHFSAGASATGNPALIVRSTGGEFTFGGTYLAPSVDIEVTDTRGGVNDLTASSSAKQNTSPYAAVTHNLGNGFSMGGSIFGAAGMGTDWTEGSGAMGNASVGDVGLYSMKANFTLLKLSTPLAYEKGNWAVGIAPVMVFGTLKMNFRAPDLDGVTLQPLPTSHLVDNGISSGAAFGFELGALYSYKPYGLTFGAVYHSALAVEYINQISSISRALGYGTAGSNFDAMSDTLEQPTEYGIGIDWTMGDISITGDFRNILWGEAEGYSDFNWENQTVYSVGAEYRIDALSLRIGYNYGKNPIKVNDDPTPVSNQFLTTNGDAINLFNHVMFPAVTEQHYTMGVGYQFNTAVSLDVAMVYGTSPDVSANAKSVGVGIISVTNDQFSTSVALNVLF